MGISLSKGGNVSLSKEEPGLNEISIGLGWDVRATDGGEFDLDASLFALALGDKVRAASKSPNGLTDDISDFCFYGNLRILNDAVIHKGDNRTGAGDGDDETIDVTLNSIPADIQKLAVVITIAKARELGLNFGMVSNAFARIINRKTGREIVRYDLSEDAATETAIVIGEVYRHNGEWKFRAVSQGFAGGLYKVCHMYGINADDNG
ncbi:TerD family protein [Sphingomonas sp. 3-13AW]|uniref:TerD family protein n=1 Tax=Sphingomonas sp. 3-13AW TaxID=3050450 RepID=UPI003BB66BBD